jgi:hypothetical protein
VEYNPPISIFEKDCFSDLEFRRFQQKDQQIDGQCFVWGPILADPGSGSLNKPIKPKRRARVGRETFVLTLLIAQSH